MVKPFSLDHLSPAEFEEFCRDLLSELGFINIDWRKGTGLSTSPSDQGRDIECKRRCEDVDGSMSLETWFIECKHSLKGVPPDKIQNVLAWAHAERPDKVLVICSNFLSNGGKEYLNKYETTVRPPFKIKVWERVDLENLTVGKAKLRRKYRIDGDFPYLEVLHPAHVLYQRNYTRNSAQFFFDVLDELERDKRDHILSFTSELIIQPRYRPSETGKETMNDLRIDDISYDSYKRRFIELTYALDQGFLIFAIITFTLKFMFHLGDFTTADEVVDKQRGCLEYFDEQLEQTTDDDERDSLLRCREIVREKIESWPTEVRTNYASYEFFCENVVAKLLLEPLNIDLPESHRPAYHSD